MARPERRFYFRLALELGKTVREMLSGMDSRELTEWIAYYCLLDEFKNPTKIAKHKMQTESEVSDQIKAFFKIGG